MAVWQHAAPEKRPLVEQGSTCAVDMRGTDANAAIRLAVELDEAEIGEPRHRQSGQHCQRGLHVEGRAQGAAGVGQEARTTLLRLCTLSPLTLLLMEDTRSQQVAYAVGNLHRVERLGEEGYRAL